MTRLRGVQCILRACPASPPAKRTATAVHPHSKRWMRCWPARTLRWRVSLRHYVVAHHYPVRSVSVIVRPGRKVVRTYGLRSEGQNEVPVHSHIGRRYRTYITEAFRSGLWLPTQRCRQSPIIGRTVLDAHLRVRVMRGRTDWKQAGSLRYCFTSSSRVWQRTAATWWSVCLAGDMIAGNRSLGTLICLLGHGSAMMSSVLTSFGP